MRKVFPVLKREYVTRVKTKGFLVSTLVLPLVFAGIFVIPVLLVKFSSRQVQRIAVVDLSRQIWPQLQAAFPDTLKDGHREFVFVAFPASSTTLDEVEQKVTRQVESGEFRGLLVIPAGVLQGEKVQYFAKNVSNFRLNERLSSRITRIANRIRLQSAGLDPTQVQKLTESIGLETFKLTKKGKGERDSGATFAVTYVLVFLLYMTLLVYGSTVMRSVLEEKTSRVVEVVLSSVSPFQLMAGKIIGVGAVGLTQLVIWGLTVLFLSIYGLGLAASMGAASVLQRFHIPPLDPLVFFYFLVFFLLGYVLYSSFYAAIGAMTNSEQEAAQLQTPLILFLVLPILMIIPIVSNPNSPLAVGLSLFPLTAPVIMFMRISILMPPFWQIVLSLILLTLTIWGAIWLTSRIYRVGILMYGKRPSLPEILKWLRY